MNSPAMRGTRTATLAILVVTFLWGFTFVWMSDAILAGTRVLGADRANVAIALFMAIRFSLAALLMPMVISSSRTGLSNAQAWRGGGMMGFFLLVGFFLQMAGLRELDPAVSAFLTSLYVLFTALLTGAATRLLSQPSLGIGVLLATVGAAYVGGPPELSFSQAEWLTVLCALVFAMHIIVTDRVTKACNPMQVTFTSFCWVALGSFGMLGFLCWKAQGVRWEALYALSIDPEFLVPMVCASTLATVVALTLMNRFQRELGPVRAAVLYALEPIWAGIFAWVARGEEQTDLKWLLFGGSLLLLGNLVVEIGPRLLRSQKA